MKPWKPKRPVPTSKDPPAKLILDEADDFPRGGGEGKNTEMKNKKRKKTKQGPSVPPGRRDGRPDRLFWTVAGEMQGSKSEKKKKKRKNPNRKVADKKHDVQMYPTDENLFIIKQRKCSR